MAILGKANPFMIVLLVLLSLLFNIARCESISQLHGLSNRAAATTTSKTFTLFDDLDGSGNFIPRSVVTITSSSADDASVKTVGNSNNEGAAVSVAITDVGSTRKCATNITSFETGLYRLKLVDDVGHEAISSVSYCSMRRSLNVAKQQFREKLEIMVTSTGDLMSFSMTPIISPLAPPCSADSVLLQSGDDVCFTFKTQVTIEGATLAATVPLVLPASRPPPGLLFFPTAKLGVNGDPRQPEGQEQPHKSFFVRYWYIILPALIMTLMGGGEGPPPPPSAGAATRTGTTATSNTVPRSEAGVPETSTGAAKRRGKRD